ncbi:MAG: hypothetical protein Ct9H90mP23_2530 [Methanobacteriota archaeon]|nr:MAG: hypothetical protein Ct9H90mP23_2530 [Euryarchaeota archaeon]
MEPPDRGYWNIDSGPPNNCFFAVSCCSTSNDLGILINGNWQSPLCSRVLTGSKLDQQVPGSPLNCNSGVKGPYDWCKDGNLYRGKPGCEGKDIRFIELQRGLTFGLSTPSTETTGTADTWNFEEGPRFILMKKITSMQCGWVLINAYYSYSRDEGILGRIL